MRVTIRQIAEESGVSRGTVDRVLNNRGKVRPEVEERVRKVAAGIVMYEATRQREICV